MSRNFLEISCRRWQQPRKLQASTPRVVAASWGTFCQVPLHRSIPEISGKFPRNFREISGKFPGNFREISGKFPGNFREISGKFPGNVHEISGKFPGNVREISGKFPGNFREISGKFPGNFRKNPVCFGIWTQTSSILDCKFGFYMKNHRYR